MNKKLTKILSCLILFALLLGGVKMDTNAAGGLSISASAREVSVGGTFTVTVKAAGNYFVSKISLKVTGGDVVSNLGAKSLDKGESTSATIKLTGDNCVVSVIGEGANYDTMTEEAASASVSVKKKVVVVDTRSKDNNLSSITVSEGVLSPEFNSSTTEYSVSVGGTTEKITLSASAKDAKAKVSGTGEQTVVPGNNRFVIICTAENGKTKEYIVNVYVDETPIVFATYGEQSLGVVRNQTEIQIPATFEPATVTLDEQEVPAYHSNQLNTTLVYLQNEAGDKNFYIYEEEKGITSIFRPLTLVGRNVIVYDLTEEEKVRENMVYSEVEIDGVQLYGWTYENPEFENYIHIKVMNEAGKKVVYQYEKSENSLQLYRKYVPLEPEEKVMSFSIGTITFEGAQLYILGGLAGLCVILIVVIVILACTKKKTETKSEKKTMPAKMTMPEKKTMPARKRRYMNKLEKRQKKEQQKLQKED